MYGILFVIRRMVEIISSYKSSNLEFSSSKLFFQNQNLILQKAGFISPASIDTYYKYTFQQVQPYYFIQGGEFEGITLNHDVCECGIIYKLGFLHPKFQHVKYLSIDLLKKAFDTSSLWSMMKTFPLIQWGLFLLILCILPFAVGKWLFWLNLVGVGVLFLFSIFKTLKIFYQLVFKTNRSEYKGFSVDYDYSEDVLFLTPDVISCIKQLKDLQITKILYTGNCLYLLQDIHAPKYKFKNLIKRVIYSSRIYSEPEKAVLQQKTMAYLQQSDFLFNFSQY